MDAPTLILRPDPGRLRAARAARLTGAAAVLVLSLVLIATAPLARTASIWLQEAAGLGVLWALLLVWLGLSLRPAIEIRPDTVRRRTRLRWRTVPRAALVEMRACSYLTPSNGRARYGIVRDSGGAVVLALRLGVWSEGDLRRLRDGLGLGEGEIAFEERGLHELARDYPGLLPYWQVHPNVVGAAGGVTLTLLVALGVILSGQASHP